jgi:hypothetical protein
MKDNQEEWEEIYNLLVDAYCLDDTGLIENDTRYKPENLKSKTLQELEDLYDEYASAVEGLDIFNRLQYEEGWENVWDD